MEKQRHRGKVKEQDVAADILEMYKKIKIKPSKKKIKAKKKYKPKVYKILIKKKTLNEIFADKESIRLSRPVVAKAETKIEKKVKQDIKKLKPELKKVLDELPYEIDMDVPDNYAEGYGKRFRAGITRYYHSYPTYKAEFRTPAKHKHFLKLNKKLSDSKASSTS